MVEEVIYKEGKLELPSRTILRRLLYIVHIMGLISGFLVSLGIYLFFEGLGWISLIPFGLGLMLGPPINSKTYDILLLRKK